MGFFERFVSDVHTQILILVVHDEILSFLSEHYFFHPIIYILFLFCFDTFLFWFFFFCPFVPSQQCEIHISNISFIVSPVTTIETSQIWAISFQIVAGIAYPAFLFLLFSVMVVVFLMLVQNQVASSNSTNNQFCFFV